MRNKTNNKKKRKENLEGILNLKIHTENLNELLKKGKNKHEHLKKLYCNYIVNLKEIFVNLKM